MNLEALVDRIWTQLSAFQESAAACVSDTLRHVSNEMYTDAIRAAEKLVLHVEVLFAVIDELEAGFTAAAVGGITYVREARMLFSKIVAMFNVLSRPRDPLPASSTSQVQHQARGTDQELKLIVTSLLHYTKVLVRSSLTGALRLERDHSNREALSKFLDRFLSLKMDCTRLNNIEWMQFPPFNTRIRASFSEPAASLPPNTIRFSSSTTVRYPKGAPYGYRSPRLEGAGESLFSPKAIAQGAQNGSPYGLTPPSAACVACQSTIDEKCVRLGRIIDGTLVVSSASYVERRPLLLLRPANLQPTVFVNVDDFRYAELPVEVSSPSETKSPLDVAIYCTAHATLDCPSGFDTVSRLEKYAFLLYVGVWRLDLMLQRRRDSNVIARELGALSEAPRPDFLSTYSTYTISRWFQLTAKDAPILL